MERLAFTCRLDRRPAAGEQPGEDSSPAVAQLQAVTEPERETLAFRALLAFMFVLLVRPQDQLPFLAPFHLAEILGTLAFLSVVASRLSRGAAVSRGTPELVGVLAFAAVMVGTVPFSFWPGGSMSLFTEQFAKIVIVFVVMVNTLTSRERLEQFITLIVFGATYVGLRAGIDYARGANLVEGGRVAGAVGGLFGNPNDMALNMVTFLPLAVGLALDRRRPVVRLLGLLGIPAMIGAIIFSQSRGGTVGLIAMVGVLLFYMRRVKPAIAAIVVVAGLASLPLLPASFTARMASIFDAEQDTSGSREARKTLLKEGWHVFLDNPLIGIGAGQFTNYNPEAREEAWHQTHNAPLQVASELGLVGLAVFAFVVWSGFSAGTTAVRVARGMRRRPRRKRPVQAEVPAGADATRMPDPEWLELSGSLVVAAMTGWFVAALFASVAYYWTLYLVLGIAVAIRDAATRAAARARAPRGTALRAA